MYDVSEYYMNTGDLQSDYFNVEMDENPFHLLQRCDQVKPSSDDFINNLFDEQKAVIASNENRRQKENKSPNQVTSQPKARKTRKNNKTSIQGKQRGHWSSSQSKRYHWFLELHCTHFVNKYLRRTDKIFKTMEKFVETREAQQCRSHHQKMEKKHGNFINILKELRTVNYGCGEPELILLDMRRNDVEFSGQLLSWATLLAGMEQKWELLDGQKSTPTEVSPSSEGFIDPLDEMQAEGEQFLQLLIL